MKSVPPVLVSANGSVAEGGYPWAPPLNGGFTVLELPSSKEAIAWAARIGESVSLRIRSFESSDLIQSREVGVLVRSSCLHRQGSAGKSPKVSSDSVSISRGRPGSTVFNSYRRKSPHPLPRSRGAR